MDFSIVITSSVTIPSTSATDLDLLHIVAVITAMVFLFAITSSATVADLDPSAAISTVVTTVATTYINVNLRDVSLDFIFVADTTFAVIIAIVVAFSAFSFVKHATAKSSIVDPFFEYSIQN